MLLAWLLIKQYRVYKQKSRIPEQKMDLFHLQTLPGNLLHTKNYQGEVVNTTASFIFAPQKALVCIFLQSYSAHLRFISPR